MHVHVCQIRHYEKRRKCRNHRDTRWNNKWPSMTKEEQNRRGKSNDLKKSKRKIENTEMANNKTTRS